jgi:hypothetical protein
MGLDAYSTDVKIDVLRTCIFAFRGRAEDVLGFVKKNGLLMKAEDPY